MNTHSNKSYWNSRSYPAVLDVLRILLGLFLLVKGCIFLQNIAYLKWVLSDHHLQQLSPGLITFVLFYVIFFHMTGGTLLMLGIWTRLAALVQLPILGAAVLLLADLRSPLNSQLWLSVVCGILLVVFLVIGSGRYSLDHYLAKKTGI